MLKIGDKVVTDFYPKDSKLVRDVIRIEKYTGSSESGWKVTTRDTKGRLLACDMNWYRLAHDGEYQNQVANQN